MLLFRFFIGILISLFHGWAAAQSFNLGQLIQFATESYPSVLSQLSNVKAAEIGIETAEYQRYPVPQISYENIQKSSSDPSYIGSDGVTTFRISQPIFTGGLFSAQLEKAKANLQVSQAGVRETRRQIALRVVQAYADWNSADLKVKSIEKSLVIHQKLLQQAKNRIAQGASPSSDLTLVQSRIDATMGELFSAKLQSELAIQKLNELTGVTVNASQLQAGKTGPVQHKQPIESLLANAQALIAKSSAQEKESALKPDIYVRAERQYGNYFSNNTNPSTRIFIGVSSKFGPGLSSFTQISAAKAQEDSSEFEIQSQQRLVRETVLNDVSVLRSLQEKMQVLEGALQASQSVLESFERQFNAGRKSWLDLMTIAKDVAQNETQLAELRGSQLQTSWRLQILTSDNYAQVNPAPWAL